MPEKILITGASGFIGRHLCDHLQQQDYDIRAVVRTLATEPSPDTVVIDDIGPNTDWTAALADVDIVIHLAGCVHQLDSSTADNSVQFNRVNVEGTYKLAKQAALQHIKRFIFISTVKVYGENIANDIILTESSTTGVGCDAYGLSKLAGEQQLMKVAVQSAMDFVIIRSPLVYGPGVGANFKSLMELVATGVPLPFLQIDNQRSMVAIDNLIDFIACCATSDYALNQIFLISDCDDISLPRLISMIREATNLSPRLFKFPLSLLKFLALLLGKYAQLAKLTDSLRLDTGKANQQLGWKPVVKVEDSIKRTVRAHQKSN